ncbi:MAG TPA: hypothetical protein PLR98_14015, partial [Chitinophagaceae bacterium]|nr:hypothetical protein [Chitinophagaceae bacterium]
NEYAQSVSDSFIYSLYLNNYKTKIRKENTAKDSVSIFELRIVPKLVVTPRGDSDVYDIAYAFTDINCSKYYDSILKSQEPIIYGLRFSLSERKVICYLSSDRKLLIDSSFMNIHKKTKQPDFIKVVEKNIPTITDEKLKTFLKHLLSTQ